MPTADEGLGLIGLAVGEVFAFLTTRQVVDSLAEGFVSAPGLIVGIKVTGGLPVVAPSLVLVISLAGREPCRVSKVPFANVSALVALAFEDLCN